MVTKSGYCIQINQVDSSAEFATKAAIAFEKSRFDENKSDDYLVKVIPVRVECYSGYKHDERPVRFTLGGRTYEIVEIEDQWYSPEAIYFRVKADDERVYLLRHDEIQDLWSLEAFRYR